MAYLKGDERRELAVKTARRSKPVVKWILISISALFIFFMLILPLISVLVNSLKEGFDFYIEAISTEYVKSALVVTLIATVITVIVNTFFGIMASWLLTKFSFKGKQFLATLIDIPFSISPVIAGLAYIMTFGRSGWAKPIIDWIKATFGTDIKIVFADDWQREYPQLTPKEREDIVAKKYGAVFITGIGGKLDDGTIHDGRAPDYDDWITECGDGHRGLNGDILVWNPVLNSAFELSSMGIRVSPESLKAQLEERGMMERAKLDFHSKLLNGELTQTLGGGIGQSRLCMFLLRKAHIGETQVSIWSDEIIKDCEKRGIKLL